MILEVFIHIEIQTSGRKRAYTHQERVRICGLKSTINRKEKMKLNTLLKQVGLQIYPELDSETDQPRLGSTGYAIHQDREVIADGIQTPELAIYLCHAANVLPELVAACQSALEVIRRVDAGEIFGKLPDPLDCYCGEDELTDPDGVRGIGDVLRAAITRAEGIGS
jgi:hypothetical protein